MSCFFFDFGVALGAPWDGLTCNPYAPAQSKHTFLFLHIFLKKGSKRCYFGSIWGKKGSKNWFNKRVPPKTQKGSKEEL